MKETLVGATEIELRTWNHVALVRDGESVTVYLNGRPDPEITGRAALGFPPDVTQVFLGGRNDNLFNFEGKIDEVAVYDRSLTPQEVAQHYSSAQDESDPP